MTINSISNHAQVVLAQQGSKGVYMKYDNLMEFKLQDGFQPIKYSDDVEADYLFSHSEEDDYYLLLNVETFGHISQQDVEKLIEKRLKVLVVELANNTLYAYNIDSELALEAHIKHKTNKRDW